MALPGIWQISDLSEAKVATTIEQKTNASIIESGLVLNLTDYLLRLDIFIVENVIQVFIAQPYSKRKVYRSRNLHIKWLKSRNPILFNQIFSSFN